MGRELVLVWAVGLVACTGHGLLPIVPAKARDQVERYPAHEATARGDNRENQPYALTISGGVSLGAYEAGLNWAVLELLLNTDERRANLLGVTGASAGSINALLTTIRWCQSRSRTDVEHNLFSDTWRNIGFDELIPDYPANYALSEDSTAYGADLVLSRKNAFSGILKKLSDHLTIGDEFKTCDLKLGLTVTSRDAKLLSVGGLRAENQRYVIPLRVRSDGTSIEFFVDTGIARTDRKDLLGNLLFLAPDHVISGHHESDKAFMVDPPKVLRAALASSAFPGAFGPIEISHCVPESECSGGAVVKSARCLALGNLLKMKNAVQCTQKFIDGGVFDNVPLGVAMAQLESEQPTQFKTDQPAHGPRPLRYIYMTYDNRRGVPSRMPVAGKKRPEGPLGDTLAAVENILGTAQQYELHNVLRYNAWNAGTAQQAYLVANVLESEQWVQDSEAAQVHRSSRPQTASAVAGELGTFNDFSVTASGERSRKGTASWLREKGKDLEKGSLPDADYLQLRDDVLAKLEAVCSRETSPRVACPGEAVAAIAGLRADVRNERELVLTHRFSPLTGMHAGHFGAFFDRPLRDYDYYAGVYDGLHDEAYRRCATRSLDSLRANSVVQAGPGEDCLFEKFNSARKRLGLTSGIAYEVTEALWAAEHQKKPVWPTGDVGKVMKALFDAKRCDPGVGESLTKAIGNNGERYCLHDLGLEPFLRALEDAEYHPSSKFLAWAMAHPSRWWVLPAAYASERIAEVADREDRGTIGFIASLGASYFENDVDQGTADFWVAPSSLPRRFGLIPRSLFPFFAISMHPTRRLELGLLRGGGRVSDFDLLADVSVRTTVRPRVEGEGDNGYGLFTRGALVPQVSGNLILRLGHPIFWSVGVRSGIPIEVANLGPKRFSFEEQVNTELVLVMLGDKLRFAVGCNPLAAPPNQDCWRDLYYSFGVNDLAGLAYWTGVNPFKLERLAIPFVAARVSFPQAEWAEGVAVDIGLLRAGFQPISWLGVWGDISVVGSTATTINGSLALEFTPPWRWMNEIMRSVALRAGLPFALGRDVRIFDSNVEVVLVERHGLRLAIGWFPGRDNDEDDPLTRPYASIGFDPGSILFQVIRRLRPAPETVQAADQVEPAARSSAPGEEFGG